MKYIHEDIYTKYNRQLIEAFYRMLISITSYKVYSILCLILPSNSNCIF